MSNCLVKKNPATVQVDLPYFGQALKVHADDISGWIQGNELSVSGNGDLLVYTTNGKRLTIGGVLKDNPFVYHNGGSFGVLPDGTYDIIIIDKSYGINTVKVEKPGLSVDTCYPLSYRNLTIFKLPENSKIPQDTFDMLNVQNDIVEVVLTSIKSDVKFSLDVFKDKIKLTMLNLNNNHMQGRIEDLYEAQCKNRNTAGSCTFVFGNVGVTFNGAAPATRHIVTFDGAGSCVVKDNSNNTLGSYNGFTWNYA